MNRTINLLFSLCIMASVLTGCGQVESSISLFKSNSSQPPAQSKDPREDIYNKSIYIVNALVSSINNHRPLTQEDSNQHNKIIQSMFKDLGSLDQSDPGRKVFAYMTSLQMKYADISKNASNPNSPSTVDLVRQFNSQVDRISSITGRQLEKIDMRKFDGTQL